MPGLAKSLGKQALCHTPQASSGSLRVRSSGTSPATHPGASTNGYQRAHLSPTRIQIPQNTPLIKGGRVDFHGKHSRPYAWMLRVPSQRSISPRSTPPHALPVGQNRSSQAAIKYLQCRKNYAPEHMILQPTCWPCICCSGQFNPHQYARARIQKVCRMEASPWAL